jgi:hypothetical protein
MRLTLPCLAKLYDVYAKFPYDMVVNLVNLMETQFVAYQT